MNIYSVPPSIIWMQVKVSRFPQARLLVKFSRIREQIILFGKLFYTYFQTFIGSIFAANYGIDPYVVSIVDGELYLNIHIIKLVD